MAARGTGTVEKVDPSFNQTFTDLIGYKYTNNYKYSTIFNEQFQVARDKDEFTCGEMSRNKLFEGDWQFKEVNITVVEGDNFGIVCTAPIPRDMFICSYVGEVKTGRPERNMKYALPIQEKGFPISYIDATGLGNYSRFITHSATPNCTLHLWLNNRKPQLVLKAKKDIKMGQLLTITYPQKKI